MIVELKKGFRLIRHSRDKNWRLVNKKSEPVGMIRAEQYQEFIKIFGKKTSQLRA